MTKTLGSALMLYSAVVLIASPICYWVWSRGDWRKTRAGRHLMAFMGGLALVMVLSVTSFVSVHLLERGPLPDWVRPLVWLIVGFIGTWRLALLWQTRYRGD
jgi:drug/metabolite transporter (DMT)-like permease